MIALKTECQFYKNICLFLSILNYKRNDSEIMLVTQDKTPLWYTNQYMI